LLGYEAIDSLTEVPSAKVSKVLKKTSTWVE